MLAAVLAAFGAGFGQYGTAAALGDVARSFGHLVHGPGGAGTIAEQAGLSGTELGVGLAVIRLASLGGLPLAGLADRLGRRTVLLGTLTVGLALTVVTAASPGYWWFVGLLACGRPLLSATNGLAQVYAGEQTTKTDRAKAVAAVAAGYALGAGCIAVVYSLWSGTLGFRGVYVLAVVPLALVPALARRVREPDRFVVAEAATEHPLPVLGAVGPRFRRRLGAVAVLALGVSVITGPANTFAFLYGQNVLNLSGVVRAAMVVGSGVTGLVGLLLGRWMADTLGRRPTGALGVIGIAVFGTLAYTGSAAALVGCYMLGVLAGAVFAPAAGSLLNELFPTSVRASVAGWWVAAGVVGAVVGLVVFGAVADVGDRFSLAAACTFLPVLPVAGLFWAFPETRGHEPEDLWGDPPG